MSGAADDPQGPRRTPAHEQPADAASDVPVDGDHPPHDTARDSAGSSANPAPVSDTRPDDTTPETAVAAEAAEATTDPTDVSAQAKSKRRKRTWMRWLRLVFMAVVLVILVVEAILIWPRLADSWEDLESVNWGWMAAAFAVGWLSMDSFAQIQRTLLNSAGVRVTQWRSLSLVLAANSVSQTMPGGLVLAPAFTFRETRRWGATPVVASWQVVLSGLLQGAGLAVLGLGGALLAGAKTSPFSVIFSVVGFVAVAALAQFAATHPEHIEALLKRILVWINDIRDKPLDHGVARLSELSEQLHAVKLTQADMGKAFFWSLFNWATDVLCLMFACWAVGTHPSISGLMVAYAASKAAAAAVPLLPGGLGVMDGVLVPALTTAGSTLQQAVLAVLAYRLVSWLMMIIVGWVVVAVMYRGRLRVDTGPA